VAWIVVQHEPFENVNWGPIIEHPRRRTVTMDEKNIPAWAIGPDCFESDEQRRDVERNRGREADNLINAYCLGDLHVLANALERFQQDHRLLYREELRALHHQLAHSILFLDRWAYGKDFPLRKNQRHHEHSA
jgi:hypothetical protein